MTLDEARAKLGRQDTQKTAGSAPADAGNAATAEMIKSAVAEALRAESVPLEPATITAANWGADPEVIKAAVAEAVSPLMERLDKADKRLKEQGKVLDAIADQPDPNVTAYRGVALGSPATLKASSPPAAGAMMSDRAERAQATLFNAMHEQWRTAVNPEDREYAWDAMKEMTGLKSGNAMT